MFAEAAEKRSAVRGSLHFSTAYAAVGTVLQGAFSCGHTLHVLKNQSRGRIKPHALFYLKG